MKKVIVMASGGIDSLTTIGLIISQNKLPIILSFDYGQRNLIELSYLKKSLEQFSNQDKIIHKIIKLNFDFLLDNESGLTNVKDSSLIDKQTKVEKYNDINNLPESEVPNTYVPARNTIFISYALSFAESFGIDEIYLGIHKQDAPNYPDCTQEYLNALNNLASVGFKNNINIKAPLIDMNKFEIVKLGKSLGIDYKNTISCYDPIDGKACHSCHSCLIRDSALRDNDLTI